MKAAFYAGASGLTAYQQAMDTIGNNLSNCNTPGFKKEKVGFDDLLYQQMAVNTPNQPLAGNGVRAISYGVDFSQGDPTVTGGMLDFAIMGEGAFALQDDQGISYSRDGSFTVSAVDGRKYLTSMDGAYVLDSNKQRIELPDTEVAIAQYDGLAEKIGVFRFQNFNALSPISANRYQATAESGNSTPADKNQYEIRAGFLEGSTTSLVDEMASLITAQRGFQLSARVVQTADQIEEIVNNLRR